MASTRKAAETFTRNAFETTLSSTFGATDTTATVASTSGLTSPCYLVIEPDSATQREYVFFDGTFTSTQLVTSTADNRYLTGSAAASGLSHPQNSVVRMVPVQQVTEDMFDAIGQVVDVSYASGSAGTPKLAADLDANNNKITNLTSPSVAADAANKSYVDSSDSTLQAAIDSISAGTASQTISITLKVADDGSGSQNVYYFLSGTDSGAGTREVALDLKVGFKYKFDQSDTSNTGHPFRFSLTKDGTHNSGSEFTTNVTTNGTPGSAGAYTQIEITPETVGRNDDNTPKLYYYCTAHSGMGGEGQLTLTTNNLQNYVEKDVTLTSSSGVVAIDLANGNTGSLTLTESVTDIDFTNVPENGVSTFTVKVTQDASSAYTVAINAITVNGGSDVTAKTAGAGGFTMTATLGAEDILFFLFFNAGTPYLTVQQEMS